MGTNSFTVIETREGVAYQVDAQTVATMNRKGEFRVHQQIPAVVYRAVVQDAARYVITGMFRPMGKQKEISYG